MNNQIEDSSKRVVAEVESQVNVLGRNSDIQRAIKLYGRIGGTQDSQQIKTGYHDDASQIDTRKRKSVMGIFREDMADTTETVLEDVLMLPTSAIRHTLGFITAYKILFGMLIFSLFLNFFLSGRSTAGYWQQRKAEKFMQKVGVKPNSAMIRMVSLKEINELVSSGLTGANSSDSGLW